MNICYQNEIYCIPNDVWEKHKQMHPVRTEEALVRNIDICRDDKDKITAEFIVKVIEDEYNVSTNMESILNEARTRL